MYGLKKFVKVKKKKNLFFSKKKIDIKKLRKKLILKYPKIKISLNTQSKD